MEEIILQSITTTDEITEQISKLFDYEFNGVTVETIQKPDFPSDFRIGLIVGSSGSGKSTLLKECFEREALQPEWDETKSIASHFDSYEDAVSKFGAVGLNSVPTWMKPYSALSNGERFRADLARKLHSGAVIDEFTSVVNRQVAVSCSISISKYIRNNDLREIVFASCHDDIVPYLSPDWCYNTDTHTFYNGKYLQRPSIELQIQRCDKSAWDAFSRYHYLSSKLNNSSACYLATIENEAVAFVATITQPAGGLKNAYREHRLVVHPDYQGMGIGNKVSETIAQMYIDDGCRYFSKTANPRCGEHRDRSVLWKPTSHNHKKRTDYFKSDGEARLKSHRYSMNDEMLRVHSERVCYSHEYTGGAGR